jgi:hypothetical protein
MRASEVDTAGRRSTAGNTPMCSSMPSGRDRAVLALQRSAGNAAVSQLFGRRSVQRAPTFGTSWDYSSLNPAGWSFGGLRDPTKSLRESKQAITTAFADLTRHLNAIDTSGVTPSRKEAGKIATWHELLRASDREIRYAEADVVRTALTEAALQATGMAGSFVGRKRRKASAEVVAEVSSDEEDEDEGNEGLERMLAFAESTKASNAPKSKVTTPSPKSLARPVRVYTSQDKIDGALAQIEKDVKRNLGIPTTYGYTGPSIPVATIGYDAVSTNEKVAIRAAVVANPGQFVTSTVTNPHVPGGMHPKFGKPTDFNIAGTIGSHKFNYHVTF